MFKSLSPIEIALIKKISGTGGGGGGGESGGGGSTFESSASGRIPEYEHGYATAELTNLFTTSATGSLS